jgi:uncharacterized protein related to proFAR isomerase
MSDNNSSFESVMHLVSEQLDLNDPFVSKEFDRYRKDAEEEVRWSRNVNDHSSLKSAESVAIAAQYVADLISASATKEKLDLLTEKSKLAKSSLDIALRILESVSEQSVFDVYTLAVRKEPSVNELREVHKKLISSSAVIADLPQEELQSIAKRINYPDSIREIVSHRAVRQYLTDLSLFLISAGIAGRNIVRTVCERADAAARVLRKKDDYPAPIVFLSQLSRDLNPHVAAKTPSVNKRQPIGFVNA